MTQDQQLIWNYLQNHANGSTNKKTSDDIRTHCNLPAVGRTNEIIRFSITDMILNHGYIIASDSHGYWIPNTSNEVQDVCKSLYDRADEIRQRADALKQNWNNANQNDQIP